MKKPNYIILLSMLLIQLLCCFSATQSAGIENTPQKYQASEAALQQINQAIKVNGAKWTARMPEKIPELMPTPHYDRETPVRFHETGSKDTPEHFDWRDYDGHNWVAPVKDQGGIGSCWAFGTCACIEPKIKIHADDPELPVDLSESYLVNCSDAGSEGGGWQRYAAAYIIDYGIVDEQCSPYVDYPLPCSLMCDDWESRLTFIDSYDWVFSTNRERYKEAIMEGPLAASVAVYEDFFYYESGVYEYTWGAIAGGHVVLVCGWDNDDSCWIAKNSWGRDWGEGGYFKIRWGNCYIEMDMMSVEVSHYPPYGFPELSQPRSGVVINHGPITFNWDDLDLADSYEFMLARDVSFTELVLYETGLSESRFAFTGELDMGMHYWRARGCNGEGCSSWSSGFTFYYTSASIDEPIVPGKFQVDYKAFPNPFNSTVAISVFLPKKTPINISIYNLWGEEIAELGDEGLKEGVVEYRWQPQDLASGVYLYKIETSSGPYLDRLYYMK